MRKTVKILAAIAGVIALFAVVGACGDLAETDTISDDSGASQPAIEEVADEAEDEPAPKLRLKDFDLEPKVTDKQCFGSAGCNVIFEVELAYTGTAPIEQDYELTYEVSGIEDGPMVSTLTIHSDGMFSSEEHFVSTSSNGSKIKIKPTRLEPVL